MKKTIQLLMLSVAFPFLTQNLCGQVCVGNIDIDDFESSIAFCDSMCNVLDGNISISDVNDTDCLASLSVVRGYIDVYDTQLGSLLDFQDLDSIGGSLDVSYNEFLSMVIGSETNPNLKYIGGSLDIRDNFSNDEIRGFSNVNYIGGNLVVKDNELLEDYCELACLAYVTQGEITISDNNEGCNSLFEILNNCGGCSSISYCNEDITLTSQAEVDAFSTNYDCQALQGDLVIAGTDITDLSGLSGLSSIEGNLVIENTNLVSLDGLNLFAILSGNLEITNNTLLENLDALINIDGLNGDLIVTNNDVLEDISILQNIEIIEGNVVIENNAPAMLQAKVILQGAFNGTDMNTSLTEVLPLNQPYTIAPYNYNGTETLSNIPNDMVDWILVEMRDGTPNLGGNAGTQVVETQAAILLANGNIVNIAGELLIFNSLNTGEAYHLCIRHRNHLDILSSQTINASSSMSYDFTTSADQAFGASQQISLSNGTFGMYTGDYNQDGIIQLTDYDAWIFSPAQNNVYNVTDGTLDAIIQVTDLDAWLPNKAKIGNIEIQY